MQVCYELRDSRIAGKGIFLLQPVRRGALIWQYAPGKSVIEHDEVSLLSRLDALSRADAIDLLEHIYSWEGRAIEILDDAKVWNHSVSPNSGNHPDEDQGEGDHVSSYALRDLAAGEELTDDYAGFDSLPWFEAICRENGACSCTEVGRVHRGPGAPHVVLLNAGRVNFDGSLDYAPLEAVAAVVAHEASDVEQIVERVHGASVVITKEMRVPGDVIRRFPPSVRAICEAGTGFNNIDGAAAREMGIAVCNVPSYSTEAVAHLVLTAILNFSSSLHLQLRMLATGDRSNFGDALQVPHFELGAKVLGLVGGSGAIGSKVADLALALGMRVLVSSRTPKPVDARGVETVGLDALLEGSDFISVHCPLTPTTTGLIDAKALAKCKSTAFLINTARGAVIREADLIAALQAGGLAGAALDVQEQEPPPADSPLYTLPNVILTPHLGWQRRETRQRLLEMVAANAKAAIAGAPTNVVN